MGKGGRRDESEDREGRIKKWSNFSKEANYQGKRKLKSLLIFEEHG